MFLIQLLIYFFISLIGYQLFLAWRGDNLVEGLENNTDSMDSTTSKETQPYNMNDPNYALILEQENDVNINILKDRID